MDNGGNADGNDEAVDVGEVARTWNWDEVLDGGEDNAAEDTVVSEQAGLSDPVTISCVVSFVFGLVCAGYYCCFKDSVEVPKCCYRLCNQPPKPTKEQAEKIRAKIEQSVLKAARAIELESIQVEEPTNSEQTDPSWSCVIPEANRRRLAAATMSRLVAAES